MRAALFAPLLLSSLLVACASARSVTYPPSFRYMTKYDVRSTMWQLAGDVVELARMLEQPAPLVVPADVVQRLALMETHAAELDGGARTNHPKIDANIQGFRRAITAAKHAAEATPPSYYLAGNLTGSCTSCHESK